MAVAGVRYQVWAALVLLLAYGGFRVYDKLAEQCLDDGWVWTTGVGWPAPAEVPYTPAAFYDVLNIQPNVDTDFISQVCKAKIELLSRKQDPTEEDRKQLGLLKAACATLTVEARRCHYDYRRAHYAGLWEGYVSMCGYLEVLDQQEADLDRSVARKKAELERRNAYSDEALAEFRTSIKASNDRILENTRLKAMAALAEERMERLGKHKRID